MLLGANVVGSTLLRPVGTQHPPIALAYYDLSLTKASSLGIHVAIASKKQTEYA